MDWVTATVIVASNTAAVLVAQLFVLRKQKSETRLNLVEAQHLVLEDLHLAYRLALERLREREELLKSFTATRRAMGEENPLTRAMP